jgi:hypothetical protein
MTDKGKNKIKKDQGLKSGDGEMPETREDLQMSR